MNAMSKLVVLIGYGLRLPARIFTASLSALTATGGGSSGRRVASGGIAPAIFVSADAMTSQAWSILTTRVSERLSESRSSSVVNPIRPPAVKTGPPALARASDRSERSRRGPTPVTSPGVRHDIRPRVVRAYRQQFFRI